MMDIMEKKTTLIKNGFSLVEVVAALAIMSILFIGVFQLISTATKMENNTNKQLTSESVLKSSCNILFSLDINEVKFFQNKTIRFEVIGPGDVSQMILENFKEPKVHLSNIKGDYNSSYYLDGSSSENPIEFLVYVTIKEIKQDLNNKENILYEAKLDVVSLNKNQQYYYDGRKKEGNGKEFNIRLDTKGIEENKANIILRPLD